MSARPAFRWTLNRALAAAALVLGVVALAGNPYRGSTVRLDTQELATIVGSEVDHVTPAELADWVIRGATDYRLIDLRSAEDYEAYHIPTAENVPIAKLPDYPLARNEKIVLYSDGGIHSAQAWFLLRARDYAGAYILLGGLEGWKDDVLFPTGPADPSPQEAAAFERVAYVSRFFGGRPRAATATLAQAGGGPSPAGEEVAMPKVAPPARVNVPAAPRKKKEGC